MRVQALTFRIYQVTVDPICSQLSVWGTTRDGYSFKRVRHYEHVGRCLQDYYTLSNAMHRHLVIPTYCTVPGHVRDTSRFQFKRFHVARLRLLWTIADSLGIAHLWRIKPRTRADHYR